MKIFDLSVEEVKQIKKRQIIFLVLGMILGLAIIITLLIISTRKTFILFLLLSFVMTLVMSVFLLYMILGKLRSTNEYLLILRKSENNRKSDMFSYFGREENVYVKDGNSFRKYIFIKDENKHVFYVLFDKELDLTQDKEYKLTYIDNILLELENSNEKD